MNGRLFHLLCLVVIIPIGVRAVGLSAQTSPPSPPQGTDISPEVVLNDLRARRLDPMSSPPSDKLRRAYSVYEFQAGQGNNLNSNKEEITTSLGKLNQGLAASSLRSHLTIRTKTPGARVWCRLVGTGGAHPLTQLTDSEDDLPIGIYYIWTERSNKATSSKTLAFRVISEKVSLDIEEDP